MRRQNFFPKFRTGKTTDAEDGHAINKRATSNGIIELGGEKKNFPTKARFNFQRNLSWTDLWVLMGPNQHKENAVR